MSKFHMHICYVMSQINLLLISYVMSAAYPAHLTILDLITLNILCEE
jgi:hypothetical protein